MKGMHSKFWQKHLKVRKKKRLWDPSFG